MPDERLPHRALKTSFWVAAWFILIFGLRGQVSVSLGLAVGAALGLFSLWSLIYAVPRIFEAGNRRARAASVVLLLLKLPIYAVVLYYTVNSRYINPIAVFSGIAIVPAVIVLKVLGYRLVERASAPQESSVAATKQSPPTGAK